MGPTPRREVSSPLDFQTGPEAVRPTQATDAHFGPQIFLPGIRSSIE